MIRALGHCRTTMFAALLAAVPMGGAAQTPDVVPVPVLRAGDVLRITVWRNPELSGDFAVLDDGTLAHPLYHRIRVAGLQMSVVNDSIGTFLRSFETTPAFVIEPLYRVTVGGEVRNPSVYPLAPSTTLSEAVAMAGGVTERGRLEQVRLQRAGQLILLDLTDPSPGALANTPIRSGDQLFVQRRTSLFRDYIAPAGSITAALAAIAGIIINQSR